MVKVTLANPAEVDGLLSAADYERSSPRSSSHPRPERRTLQPKRQRPEAKRYTPRASAKRQRPERRTLPRTRQAPAAGAADLAAYPPSASGRSGGPCRVPAKRQRPAAERYPTRMRSPSACTRLHDDSKYSRRASIWVYSL